MLKSNNWCTSIFDILYMYVENIFYLHFFYHINVFINNYCFLICKTLFLLVFITSFTLNIIDLLFKIVFFFWYLNE